MINISINIDGPRQLQISNTLLSYVAKTTFYIMASVRHLQFWSNHFSRPY